MINLINENIFKILTIFSLSPGSRFNRKTLKEKTEINNISLDSSLSILLNLKYLKKEKRLFSLNFKNEDVNKIIKLISEDYNKLKQLPLKEYFVISNITRELLKIEQVEEAYLFGSYSKLVFNEKSDIDIAIISENINRDKVNKIIKILGKKHKKSIEVHFFSKKFYTNKKDPLVKEILHHGIKLI